MQSRAHVILLLVCLVGACSASGCSSKKGSKTQPLGGPCVSTAECQDGAVCMSSVCMRLCGDGNSCPGGQICRGGVCDVCVGSRCLAANGSVCNQPAECDSGHCVDRTCCESSCDAPCETCFGAIPGLCVPVSAGVDVDSCSTRCFGGVCLGTLAAQCTSAAACDSGFCADGVCCTGACDGLCQNCAQPGHAGICGAVVLQEYQACVAGPAGANMCDAAGHCVTPHLLADVNGQRGPRGFVRLADGRLVFAADAAGAGLEPWVYDPAVGTLATIADLWPGPASSNPSVLTLTPDGAGVYFRANDGEHGAEPWLYSGTRAKMLDFNLGPIGSDITAFAVGSGAWMFAVGHDLAGLSSLWRTNWADTSRLLTATSDELLVLGSYVFFSGSTALGSELVRDVIDPTTLYGFDLAVGALGSAPHNFRALNGALYVIATDAASVVRLFRIDPVSAAVAAYPHVLAAASEAMVVADVEGGLVYFTDSAGAVQVNNGAAAATTLVSGPGVMSHLVRAGGHVFFARSDVVDLVTVVASALPPSAASVFAVGQVPLQITGATLAAAPFLYFVARDAAHGEELWRTDGGAAGAEVLDLWPGPTGSSVRLLGATTARTYVAATSPGVPQGIWACDNAAISTLASGCVRLSSGSAGGPYLAGALDAPTERQGLAVGTQFYFGGINEPSGPFHLWRAAADNTLVSVGQLALGSASSSPSGFTSGPAVGEVAFVANDGVHGSEVWVSDGSSSGTRLFGEAVAGAVGSAPRALVRLRNEVLFVTSDVASNSTLWASDGTTVRQIKALGTATQLSRFVSLDNRIYFGAAGGTAAGIWASDGTDAGTVIIDALCGTDPDPAWVPGVPYAYYLAAGLAGCAVHRVDGTATAPALMLAGELYDALDGLGARNWLHSFAVHEGRVYARAAYAGVLGLWASRCVGTSCTSCTSPTGCATACASADICYLGDIDADFAAAHTYGFAATLASRLYFGSSTGQAWVTDGTPAGTAHLEDTVAVLGGGVIATAAHGVAAGNLLLLSGASTATGRQLWACDGVTAWKVTDSALATPMVTAFDGRFFFAGPARANVYSASDTEVYVTTGEAGAVYPACPRVGDCSNPQELWSDAARLFISADTSYGREPLVYP